MISLKVYFEDNSFDTIVSHILFHETSVEAINNIVNEAYRILKPNGIFINLDVPCHDWHYENAEDRFNQHWQTHFNGEPFWSQYASIKVKDVVKLPQGISFDFHEMIPMNKGMSDGFFYFGLRKPLTVND